MLPSDLGSGRSRRLRRQVGAFAGVLGLALGVAACGSSTRMPAAGNGSPAAAVSGFISGIASNTPQSGCNYVAARDRAECVLTFTSAPVRFSDPGVGNTATSGDRALVAVLAASACLGPGPGAIAKGAPSTTVCLNNSNANLGLPSSTTSFAVAYAAAFNSSNSLVTACVLTNGKWFVALTAPGSSSATGGSGASGVSGSAATSGASGASGTSST
jgi:hypothetical protein